MSKFPPLSGLDGLVPVGQIVAVTGAPAHNVELFWPEVLNALAQAGIGQKLVQVGAVATIAVETARTFAPVTEYASGDAYEHRRDLGNTHPGDGRRYKGRGFVQITGRANYAHYGRCVGVDLESNPERALEPRVAGKVLATYFTDHGVAQACLAYDWRAVRKLVNGGYNGWDRFIAIVQGLL